MNRIKLLFITETFYPDKCGVADYVNILANNINKDCFQIYVITRTDKKGIKEHYTYNSVIIDKVIDSKFYPFYLWKTIKGIKPNIVDFQMSYSGTSRFNKRNIFTSWTIFFSKVFYKKAVYFLTIHELVRNRKYKSFIRKLYSKIRDIPFLMSCDAIISADITYNKYFKNKEYLFLQNFPNINTCTSNISAEKNKLVFFGTISGIKNLEFIIEILKRLVEIDRKYYITIIGTILDESYLENIRNLIKQYKLQQNVKFIFNSDKKTISEEIRSAEFTLYPFKEHVTLRNATTLASLIQGTKTIIYSNEHYYPIKFRTSNLLVIDKLDYKTWVNCIAENTGKYSNDYYTSDELVLMHVNRREDYYKKIINRR